MKVIMVLIPQHSNPPQVYILPVTSYWMPEISFILLPNIFLVINKIAFAV
jgi:hypothetical protein